MTKTKVFNLVFHYNKLYPDWGPLDKMIAHSADFKIHYPAPNGIEVRVRTFSVDRETQPKIVMACVARKVSYDSRGVLVIE